MMSWNFLSKRRKIKLEDFIKGAKTLPEALAIFELRKVKPPTDDSLERLFTVSKPAKKTAKRKATGNISYTGGVSVEVKDPIVITKSLEPPINRVIVTDVGDAGPKQAEQIAKKVKKKTIRKKKSTKKKPSTLSNEG